MYHWLSSVIPIAFIRSNFPYQIVIACHRDMRKSSPKNWMNLEDLEEHWDRKWQALGWAFTPRGCGRRGAFWPYIAASLSPIDLQVDIWAKRDIFSPRCLLHWQGFAGLWKQPQRAKPNVRSCPKSCCSLVASCHTGPRCPFREEKTKHCVQFSKEGDSTVLESSRMTSPVWSSIWRCLLF